VEKHERGAVAAGEVPHGAVRERADEVVQVADDRQPPWPRGQVSLAAAVPARPELGEEKREHDDGGQEKVMAAKRR
jgi:hypothetical protein